MDIAPNRKNRQENVPLSKAMSWYPAITPPAGSKNDIFIAADFASVDTHALNAARELNKSFRELVTYLTLDLTSDLAKVRAMFTWMGGQDIVNSGDTYSSYPAPNSPEMLMKRAAEGENASFVNLFALLCRQADVPVMTVQGRVKAAAYDPGCRDTCGKSMWIIVYVAGGWRFVHPLWAFMFVKNYDRGVWTLVEDTGKATRERPKQKAGQTRGHVDEFWFLTDPEDFNFLCHPEEPDKQLMTSPWTEDVFFNLPGLKADFFKSDWKLLGPHTAVIETNNGKCSIDLQHPVDGKAELRYKLFFDETRSEEKLPSTLQIDLYVTRLKAGKGMVSLITRLPVPGLYKLEVTGVHKGQLRVLGQFCLRCTAVTEAPKPFPSNPENGFGFDETSEEAGISNPSQTEGVMLVDKGQTIDFSFQMDEGKELQPRLLHGIRRPEELSCFVTVTRKDQQVKIGVMLPQDDTQPEYSLEIYVGGRCQGGDGGDVEVRPSLTIDSDIQNTPKKGGNAKLDDAAATQSGRSGVNDSEISNNYKRGNTDLDPVDVQSGFPSVDGSEISNSYKGGNTRLDPVPAQGGQPGVADSQIGNSYKGGNTQLDPVPADGGLSSAGDCGISISEKTGNSVLDPRRAAVDKDRDLGLMINALNYLLTSDKELHDEASNDTKELHRELQEALAQDDEAMIRLALQRFQEAGLEDPVAIAKVKAKEELWRQTREKLMVALETKSMSRINQAIETFTAHKMEDQGEVQPAVDKLMSLSERAVKSAVHSRSVQQLDTALHRVRSSHVARRARATPWFREAQSLRTNQAVEALCTELPERVKTTSILGLGDRPLNRQLLALLRSAFCLLGEDEDTVRNGQSVMSRLRETSAGKSRLLDRIKNFRVEQTTKQHVTRARKELSFCDVKQVEKDGGVTARRLHDWCRGMVKELGYHVWDDEDSSDEDDMSSSQV